MAYFSGQGELMLAKIDALTGAVGAFRRLGNVPEFSVEMDSDQVEHTESISGLRTKDFVLTRAKSMTFTGQLEDWSEANVAWATNGRVKSLAGGAVTGELSPAALVVGDIWALKGQSVSAVTITDSSTTPKTVLPADYTLDEAFGLVTIKTVTGYTLPLKAAYTSAAAKAVTFLSDDATVYALRFNGVNTVNNQKCLLELYRTQKQPSGELPLINEELGQISVQGDALADLTKTADGDFGLFGRLVYL